MTIDQQTISEILQLGGQYFIPVAVLLRALYSGARGKFPEGFAQILAASLFAGITAATDTGQPTFDLGSVIATIIGNTTFMAGLLTFIALYLLRQPDRGQLVDGIIGGIIGLLAWVGWRLLGNDWPIWTAPLVIMGGAAAFIVLRFALRQIARVVRVATYFIVIGGLLVIGAGGIWLLQSLTQTATAVTP